MPAPEMIRLHQSSGIQWYIVKDRLNGRRVSGNKTCYTDDCEELLAHRVLSKIVMRQVVEVEHVC